MAPPIPSPAPMPTLNERIEAAKAWIDKLYLGIPAGDRTGRILKRYGFLKEYMGFPIGIGIRLRQTDLDYTDFRLAGDVRSGKAISDMTKILSESFTDASNLGMDDKDDQDFNEPFLRLDREYHVDGSTDYEVTFDYYSGARFVDVWSGNRLLWRDVKTNPPGSSASLKYEKGRYYPTSTTNTIPSSVRWTRTNFEGEQCSRYTMRHGSRFGWFLYQIWGDAIKAQSFSSIRDDFGFTYDIYDPIFGWSYWEEDDFMFTSKAYHDTSDVWKTLPRGPTYYPYLSKVHISLVAYVLNSYNDPLLKTLQAIHILNKYHDVNHEYKTFEGDLIGVPFPTAVTRTPLQQANLLLNQWNGVGIAHPSDFSIASGVRTAAYFVLVTLLGWKHWVEGMKSISDVIADRMTNISSPQAGLPPLSPGHVITDLNGDLIRNPYHGSFYNLWTERFPWSAACDKPSSFLDQLIDMFNMPIEEEGPIVSNSESTASMLQALRVYNYYRWGIPYPNNKYLP